MLTPFAIAGYVLALSMQLLILISIYSILVAVQFYFTTSNTIIVFTCNYFSQGSLADETTVVKNINCIPYSEKIW